MIAGECAEGRRAIGRPERGEADLRRRLAEASEAIIRPLTFGTSARSVAMPFVVALDMLDGPHSLADGETNVLAVTSFWKSMKALALLGSCPSAAFQRHARAGAVGRDVEGCAVASGRRRGRRGLAAAPSSRAAGDAPEAAAGAGDLHGLGLDPGR